MKHTPGPWIVRTLSVGLGLPITAQPPGHAKHFNIATASFTVPKDQVAANARLMAAAPELLLAVQGLLPELEDMPGGADNQVIRLTTTLGELRFAFFAMVKAMGETPN